MEVSMIPFEELSAALERYAAMHRGEEPPTPVEHQPHAGLEAPTPIGYAPMMPAPAAALRPAAAPAPVDSYDDPTGDVPLPPLGAGDEEQTHVGELGGSLPPPPLSDDHSNEIDINDVISDEDPHHN